MWDDFVFSWAENANGEMVHVDSVPKGVACNCICPHCKEPLIARKGEFRKHGFAHHSEDRQSNLEICYEVIRYKLAEHILQKQKRIHVPSYYGIFEAADIDFVDVKIDSRYEREDKQPDVIATTQEGKQYLIEFTFKHKVLHKKDLDYNNLTCLEIDLSEQSFDTLEPFLMTSDENKRWVNNENYFKRIEEYYQETITMVEESSCMSCEIKDFCCAVKESNSSQNPIRISHNGQIYRICLNEEYEEQRRQYQEEQEYREDNEETPQKEEHNSIPNLRVIEEDIPIPPSSMPCESNVTQSKILTQPPTEEDNVQERSCFACRSNLSWGERNGMVRCGKSEIYKMGLVNPDRAKTCKWYKRK